MEANGPDRDDPLQVTADRRREPATRLLPTWLKLTGQGLWCEPGGFFVDPGRAVGRAVITHGHADHARAGHDHVLATPETVAIMQARYGDRAGRTLDALPCDQIRRIDGVSVRFVPAGHILGSAQVVLEHAGTRVVVSGDFKRRADPTCDPFEPVPCDLFITEATFGLPVFRHPSDAVAVDRLLTSLNTFPERAHLVGAYALGKAQRLIALLRQAGCDRTIWLHGALVRLCDLYRDRGVPLGDLALCSGGRRKDMAGEIVLCPPSALADRWSRGFPDPVIAMASGWMQVRQRARQRGVELPLVISDHADWDQLTGTIRDVAAPRVLVTHGQEDALVHWARGQGVEADALSLTGYADEGE